MTEFPENYVHHEQNFEVHLHNLTPDLIPKLEALGATFSEHPKFEFSTAQIKVEPATDENLADLLSKLRDLNLPFLDGPAGWTPAAIFQEFRDKGLLAGKFQSLLMYGRGRWSVMEK